MSASSAHAFALDPPACGDGLGERYVCAETATGDLLQVMRLAPALTAVPSVEFALRERTARLTNFRHPSYARVRRVDRIPDGSLAVVSDYVDGARLSDVLHAAAAQGLRFDTAAALCLVQQLLSAVALLHAQARDVAHGLIAPERLIVTPQGSLLIVEHVFASAIEQLQCGRERLWQQFRTPVPASAGGPRIDQRADVNGIGITVLSLLLGRPLASSEFPHGVAGLLMHAQERPPLGDERPLPNGLRNWLARTLQLDVRRAFASAPDALAAFEDVMAGEPVRASAPVALQAFLAPFFPRAAVPGAPAVHHPKTSAVAVAPHVPFSRDTNAVPSLRDLIATDDLADPAEPRGASEPAGAAPVDVMDGELQAPTPDHRTASAGGRSWRRAGWKPAVALVLALAGAALVASRLYRGESPSGTLVVQSSPAGVDVFVDGVHRGATPARLPVSAGSHILELRGRGVPRVIPLHVPAGGQVSQYLEFADTARTGMLVVHSQPEGATVVVDGVVRGVAPLTIEGLEPGSREVVLRNDTGSSRHVVKVLAGTAASLVAPVAAPSAQGPISGWVTINAPFTIEIYEDERLLGTTETDRLMLAAGTHTLELVNTALGYRESRAVRVNPGKLTSVALDLPTGRLDLNASPWAEVWIEGRSVGETPIGNLELPIGPYELVFRHPQFGERRHAVSVTTAAPVRVSVAMQ